MRSAPVRSDPLTFAIAPPEGATFVTPGGPVGQPWLALSPDGRVLAFVALSADGRQQLWTRPLATTGAHPLPGTDGAQAPFWSPDSRSLAFFARGKLKMVDAAGGTPQIVTDAPGYFGSGSWNRENTIVFASWPRNEGLRSVQVGAAHGQPNPSRALIEGGDSEGTSRRNFCLTAATFSSAWAALSAVARRKPGSARSTAGNRACSCAPMPRRTTRSPGISCSNAAPPRAAD